MQRRLAVVVLLLWGCLVAAAQTPVVSVGRSFWLSCVPPESDTTPQLTLQISGLHACTGTVTSSLTGLNLSFTVTPDSITSLVIPSTYAFTTRAASLQRTAIHIVATDTVSVLAKIDAVGSSAMLRVLPEPALGSDYVVQATPTGVSTIVVVATRSGRTRVSVVPTCAVAGYGANWRFSFNMTQGQCYMLKTQNAGDDFSGTIIETQDCEPIAVFMGSHIPATQGTGASMLVEQALSVDHWGSNYVLVPTGRAGGDEVAVTALDSCRLWLGGTLLTRLAARQTYRFALPQGRAAMLRASALVEVCQYPKSSPGTLSAMFGVQPLEWMSRNAHFWTPGGSGELIVVAQSSDAQSVTVDGTNIGRSFSLLQGDTTYSYARLSLWPGAMRMTHKVVSPSGVSVRPYGVWQSGEYAYEAPVWNAEKMSHFEVDSRAGHTKVRGDQTLHLCLGDTLRIVTSTYPATAAISWQAGDGTPRQTLNGAVEHSYASAGRYNARLVVTYDSLRCASWGSDTLRLTVLVGENRHTDLRDTTCLSEYLWQGSSLRRSGVYNSTLTTADGCDSTLRLHLTMGQAASTALYDTLSQSSLPYRYNRNSITFSGDDTVCTFRYITVLGCDSTVVLHLHLLRTSVSGLDTLVCDDALPVTWHGYLFTQAGSRQHVLHGAAHNGADSIVILRLAVGRTWHTTVYDTLCSGTTLSWGGMTLSEAGSYTSADTTTEGCDSVVVLWLTVSPSYHITVADTVVENRLPHFFAGRRYVASVQSETISLHTVAGCDSVIVYSLHVWRNARDTVVVTSCDRYLWCGQWLTHSGIYHTVSAGAAAGGADSIHYLLLTLLGSDHDAYYDTACDSYRWHGTVYTVSGIYHHRYTTPEGCEVVDTLHLTIGHATQSDTSAVACDRLVWNGIVFTQSADTSLLVGPNALGCDSVATMHVRINHSVIESRGDTVGAASLPWQFGGVTFYRPVTDTMLRLSTAEGCDSFIVYTLRVLYGSSSFFDTVVCDDRVPMLWHGHVFFGTSSFTDTLRGASWRGGDSIVTYALRVAPTYFLRYRDTLCDGETYTFNGGRYTQSGHYRWYTRTAEGCDSITDLTITFMPVWTVVVADTIVQPQLPWHYGGAVFNDDIADTVFHFQSIYGCDSLVRYSLMVYHDASLLLDTVVCSNQLPVVWLGEVFWSSGTRRVRFPGMAAGGADSVVVLNVAVYPVSVHSYSDTLCRGQHITMGGVDYGETGYYEYQSHTAHGCDSIERLTLTVNPVHDTVISDTILENQLPWHFAGRQYERGTARETIVLSNSFGCDSTLHYSLYVYYNFRDTLDSVLCSSSLPLVWHGVAFDSLDFVSGTTAVKTVSHSGAGAHGEDSLLILIMTANPVYDMHFYDTVCLLRYMSFDGHMLTVPDDYTYRYLTAQGCDSIRTLHLANHAAYYDLTDTQSLCSGETIVVDGYTLGETCDRLLRMQTQHGCDSIVQLHLDVWPVYNTSFVDTICDNDKLFFAGAHVRDSGSYRQVLRTVHGCDSVLSLRLAWYPHIEADFTTEPSVIDAETRELRLRDASTGAARRLWSLPSYTDTARFLRYTIPIALDSFEVLLQVWNNYGCTDTASRVLHRRYSDLWTPNAFTPGEPTNNRFSFFADSLATLEVEIYTRSGLRVATLSGVDCSWDGTFNGAPCPQGTYVYIAHYSFAYSPKSNQTKKGAILLLR